MSSDIQSQKEGFVTKYHGGLIDNKNYATITSCCDPYKVFKEKTGPSLSIYFQLSHFQILWGVSSKPIHATDQSMITSEPIPDESMPHSAK